MLRRLCVCLCVLTFTATSVSAGQSRPRGALTIVNFGPHGEIAALEEANEIRVVFSEPMVTLGRIPEVVRAPFFSVTPAIPGTFRWSGTTILIFTPDPKRPLPYATPYQVTIDASATAVSGRRLATPVTFSFTTPTVRLLSTHWYRRGGQAGAPIVVLLRFNQPVRDTDLARHLGAALEPHEWTPPEFLPEEAAQLKGIDAAALDRFAAKVKATAAVAAGSSAVALKVTTDWDKKRYPPASNLVALETTTPVAPESWVKLTVDERAPSPAGPAVPGRPQSYTIKVERAFFIDRFWCSAECNPDGSNPVRMRVPVSVKDFASALRVTDLSAGGRRVPKAAQPKPRRDYELDTASHPTLEDGGFNAQPPNRKYLVVLPQAFRSADGQTLGYTWAGIVDNWHERAFSSFGDGHGVWEKDGGAVLPFYARNLRNITQWAAPVSPSALMGTIVSLQDNHFRITPGGEGVERRLGVTADRVQSHGLDLSQVLTSRGTGLVWAAVRDGEPIPRAHSTVVDGKPLTRASIVQVTNLGITVKDSPQNTLIFVTRLDNGAPVEGAAVSIVLPDERVHWRGTTGEDGVAIADGTPLRRDTWQFAFIVTAEKDGDVAYVASDWNEGIKPWDFGTWVNLREAAPMLRGSVFTDRGVYRLGEEIHLKAILRHNTPGGIKLLPEGTAVLVTIRDTQDRLVDRRTVKVNAWSSAEWAVTLPAEGTLGNYSLRAILEADRPGPRDPQQRPEEYRPTPAADDYVEDEKAVHGSFLVAAYRRPDFRVDVTLQGDSALAGDPLKGRVTARYLFGAPLGPRPLTWRFSHAPGYEVPRAIREKFQSDRWEFIGWREDEYRFRGDLRREETRLGAGGELPLQLETARDAGIPIVYSLEGDVEDVSRQHIASRASFTVHPAPWYVGIRRPSYFIDQKNGLKTEVVAVGLDGVPAAGVPVEVTLTQIQWTSVRRAEGNGFYTWDTERKEIPAGNWQVTTAEQPLPLEIAFKNGGYFVLEAIGRAEDGRRAMTRTSFYVLGEGYTAWARYDHNRIELVPEKKTYKPGDTARIMIQSPWERATALVTTEREGIRSHRQFTLTSTQESIAVPITEPDIPNLFVSVLLVKGRTEAAATPDALAKAESGPAIGAADPSDPGKPSFRLGYVQLQVEDASKRLTVALAANKQEYRPAADAHVEVSVKDHQGRGTASEVTLWAVDYGVLSLTDFQTPDVLRSVYVQKALQVMNADARQRIISRRVLTPKGETEGGGGGADAGAGTLRKDFRVLAFWLGSVTTDAQGRAAVDVTLPESLTTYRVMAVAADRASRFGSADSEVRINKPLTLKPAFPRFLAVGDKALFGAVVTNQLAAGGAATVAIKSLDPGVLTLGPNAQQTVTIGAGQAVEVRFEGAGRAVGRARIQVTARLGAESDAFEDVIPVEILASPEIVAAYGEARDASTVATETLTVPPSVVPGFGGLSVEIASTAMVGLGEGARYLVEYPYGCAEQKGSRALALLLAADLGDAFSLPGMDTAKMRPAVQQTLKELEKFQCENGGFAYWPGACSTVSPYLTAYLLHVFRTAADLKYDVNRDVRERAYSYLERELARPQPTNESWWPSYTAWQAFAVKVLAEGGRHQDSNLTRLYGYRDRMPVFALAYLHDAMRAKRETTSDRAVDLRRRMMNAILPEGGSAHVEELSDEYLLWFWNSNVRSTAIVLNTLVHAEQGELEAPIRQLVRWLMAVRKDGRWGNTQENAHAMESLVRYYRKYESVVPDFTAIVALGSRELVRDQFRGRSAESTSKTLPMSDVLRTGGAGSVHPLTFRREGAGTLFYTARLRYAADELHQKGLDAGFNIERVYSPYVENGDRPEATTFSAGDLVKVTLRFRLTKERRFVAVTDPLPAGFEPVESWFATTARALAAAQDDQGVVDDDWTAWWRRGGFDHVERHDDRVQLFATRLDEGIHEFSYIVRATTSGTFRTAPARAEEMYEPEVFGRTATAIIEVRR